MALNEHVGKIVLKVGEEGITETRVILFDFQGSCGREVCGMI